MPRQPSVWWRESHACYYTTIRGRQVRLDPDLSTARKMFHRLMAGAVNGETKHRRYRVAELTDLWLDAVEAAASKETFVRRKAMAARWVKAIGRTPAEDLRPYHVHDWLASQAGWGPATRSLAIQAIKGCCNWSVERGYLDVNPLVRLRAPEIARREAVTEAAVAKWLSHCTEPAVIEYVTIALDTGCRPGELASLTAAGIDHATHAATVTGKTGKRPVALSDAAYRALAALATVRPDGPLLRTPKGKRWDRHSLCWWFGRVSEAAGVHIVPYHLRGVFATRSLRANGDVVTAKLLGHKDLTMLARHYEGLEETDLREAANRVSQGKRA